MAPFSRIQATATEVSRPPENAIPTRSPTGRLVRTLDMCSSVLEDCVMPCPCLSGLPYDECCGAFHSGTYLPPTAERLMRSRYAAYVKGIPQYLLRTWHPSTRPK